MFLVVLAIDCVIYELQVSFHGTLHEGLDLGFEARADEVLLLPLLLGQLFFRLSCVLDL
jgi:hypothetical protein